MGLHKELATGYGVDATYWHIGSVTLDRKRDFGQITLLGYLTKAARDEGKDPAMTRVYIIGAGMPVPLPLDFSNENMASLWTSLYTLVTTATYVPPDLETAVPFTEFFGAVEE